MAVDSKITSDQVCNFAEEKYGRSVPVEVRELVERALDMGMSFDISLNAGGARPTGSDQAASVRVLMGRKGIPLRYESKSALYAAHVNGKKCYVIAVCCGDDKIDEKALRNHLVQFNGGILEDKVDTKEEFGSNLYGLVNPLYQSFTAQNGNIYPVIHLWEERLMHMDSDYGVFTNACHPEWGFYFYPMEHPSVRVNKGIVGKFVEPKLSGPYTYQRQKILVIGGSLPQIVEEVAISMREAAEARFSNSTVKSGGRIGAAADLNKPEIVTTIHPGLALAMMGAALMPRIEQRLVSIVEQHCTQGVTLIVIPDNILAVFDAQVMQVCMHHNVKYLSMIDVVTKYLEKNHPDMLSILTMATALDSAGSPYEAILANEHSAYAQCIIPVDASETRKNGEIHTGFRNQNAELRELNPELKKLNPERKRLLDQTVSVIRTHAHRVSEEHPTCNELTVVLGVPSMSLLYQEVREHYKSREARKLRESRHRSQGSQSDETTPTNNDNLYSINPRTGVEVTSEGFKIQIMEKGVPTGKYISVKIVDPVRLYVEALAIHASPQGVDLQQLQRPTVDPAEQKLTVQNLG